MVFIQIVSAQRFLSPLTSIWLISIFLHARRNNNRVHRNVPNYRAINEAARSVLGQQ